MEPQEQNRTVSNNQVTLQSDFPISPKTEQAVVVDAPDNGSGPATSASSQEAAGKSKEGRRFSFQSLVFKRRAEQTIMLSPVAESTSQEKAPEAIQKEGAPKSVKRAFQSALAVRTLIVGPMSEAPKMTAAIAKPELKKVKSQLLEPKKANELIKQLRELPAHGDPSQPNGSGPIHAVCLSHPDEEEAALHFEKLAASTPTGEVTTLFAVPGVVAAPLDKLAEMYKEMHVINLVTTPDLGLGQPGDGEGLLAGALPTAETVIHGFEQVTPQLMALGFATGKLVMPDHTGMSTLQLKLFVY